MSDSRRDEPEREIKALRDQIARLISQNLELQRQLEDLKRDKADIPIESLAAATVRSTRSAQEAIAREVPNGNRYVVSQVQTALRGFLVEREGGLALRLPFPEHAVPSGHLGTLQMSVAQIPPPASVPGVSPPAQVLVDALERAQAAFGAWSHRRGAAAANEVVARVTRLLDMYPRWETNESITELDALAEAALKFGTAVAPRVSPGMAQKYRNAAREFRDLARSLGQVRQVTSEDQVRLAAILDRSVQQLSSLNLEKG